MIVEDEQHLYLVADDFVYDQIDESLRTNATHCESTTYRLH
jgi:hypothetical protein